MNVLVLQGSPRKEGNTATLARSFLEGLTSSGDHRIQEVFLNGLAIQPCRNCDSCRRTAGRFCRVQDDMQPLYRSFIEAGLVVLASPIYWWNVSAQMKLFVDRLYGLNPEENPQFFSGKELVLILTYAGEDPNSGEEITRHMFAEIADYTEMKIAATLRYCSADAHVRDCPQKLAEAREAGRRLGAR